MWSWFVYNRGHQKLSTFVDTDRPQLWTSTFVVTDCPQLWTFTFVDTDCPQLWTSTCVDSNILDNEDIQMGELECLKELRDSKIIKLMYE